MGPAAAMLGLNVLFTFAAVPSTPWVVPVPAVSLELLVGLGALAVFRARHPRGSRLLQGLTVACLLTASIVRYLIVVTPAVLGRDLNARADLPHLHRVVGMFWEALPVPALALTTGAAVLVLGALAWLCWLAVATLDRAMDRGWLRGASIAAALAACTSATLHVPVLARPLAPTLTAQLVAQLRTYRDGGPDRSASRLPAGSGPTGHMGRLSGADVYLIFLESYGATLVQDEQHFPRIAPRLSQFDRHLTERGFTILSNLVESPTFGGGSWRAQATVLSGLRLADEGVYDQLVHSNRRTLVSLFRDSGYRTVTVEPAIQREWPEGEFFGFDRIYDAAGLAYTGPAIGWWKIPDQYTLRRLYTEEIRQPGRAPLFAKVALIMTHIPYFPVPPYVEDWTRFDAGTAFSRGMPSIAADDYRDLDELSSRYVKAFIYELDILEAFISEMVPESALVIVSGDHQPPKLATHDNDSWAVPMHVISRNPDLVRPFYAHGFRDGSVPVEATGFKMEDFLPAFLDAFGTDTAAERVRLVE